MAEYLGIADAGGDGPLAESWQVYGEGRIKNGPLADGTLNEVARSAGAAFVGTASMGRYGGAFPLLAKFIDAAQPLSIQVHPDDDYASAHEAGSGHLGKAEAWYILEAQPGAEIIWGFRESMTSDAVRQAVAAGELEKYLNHLPVAPGDVIYNPPGTVHAIGAGVFLFEIQQASDLTYRLYDYGRRDVEGMERELHVDKALDVAHLQAGSMAKMTPLALGDGRRLLMESNHFAMETVVPERVVGLSTSPASLEIITVTRGSMVLESRSGEVEMATGESVVLPATLGDYRLASRQWGGGVEAVRCYVPV